MSINNNTQTKARDEGGAHLCNIVLYRRVIRGNFANNNNDNILGDVVAGGGGREVKTQKEDWPH